jgi:transcriptional regulator with XRE-family HTH domain
MTLAELLKDRRRRRFLTQKALAEQLGVTLNTVQRWEMGMSVPFPKQQQRLVAVLELVPEDLLDAITATEADRAKIAA